MHSPETNDIRRQFEISKQNVCAKLNFREFHNECTNNVLNEQTNFEWNPFSHMLNVLFII